MGWIYTLTCGIMVFISFLLVSWPYQVLGSITYPIHNLPLQIRVVTSY